MRFLILLLISLLTQQTWAVTQVEMVIELKHFISEVEEKSTFHDLVTFESKFQFFNEAYAADLNCFYGGWPSTLVKQGSRKYCTNPKKASPLYSQTSCANNEIACQPLLFGDGICAPSNSAQQRQSSFKYCENAFKKKGEDYSFVNKWDDEKKNDFNQMLNLAHQVCVSGDIGTQSKTGMCKNLWKKMGEFQLEKTKVEKAEVCVDETPVTKIEKNIENVLEVTRKIASEEKMQAADPHSVYQKLKEDFETSPYCDPINNYDEKGKNLMFFSGVASRLRVLQPTNSAEHKSDIYNALLDELYTHFDFSDGDKIEPYRLAAQLKMTTQGTQDFLRTSQKLQASVLDVIYKKVKEKPILKDRYVEVALENAGVVHVDDQDRVVCPFVDEETFVKAYQGYEKLESKLKKPYLTIVDYTKPSNERRLFVFDMKKGEVLGNTWVSQGMGDGSQTQGSDGFGSNPTVSNTSNSQLSSAGFIMTEQASVGKEWGENIILKGLEKQNSNIKSRAIIIHGFDSQPLPPSGLEEDFDLFDRWEQASTLEEKAGLVWEFKSLKPRPFINATYGCLGVARHPTIDRETGKKVDQLDYLRSKISNGSLIYSHASEDQQSDFY